MLHPAAGSLAQRLVFRGGQLANPLNGAGKFLRAGILWQAGAVGFIHQFVNRLVGQPHHRRPRSQRLNHHQALHFHL